MGTVWIADDPVLSRRVAVKVLRGDLAADVPTRRRFRNEAIAAARLLLMPFSSGPRTACRS